MNIKIIPAHFIPVFLLAALMLITLFGYGTALPSCLHFDSFEGQEVDSGFWSKTWWVSGQSGVDDQVYSEGLSSLRVTVKEGDHRLFGKSGQATERCELVEKNRHPLNEDLWYSFSVYVPSDFPMEDVRLVMGQWKQTALALYKKHSPVIAQRYRNGNFSITINNDAGQQTVFTTGDEQNPALIGGWTEFRYHLRFSKAQDGVLEVWMNGELVVNYEGQLAYSDDLNTCYFRLGLYRDRLDVPMTVYFDDFRVESSQEN